MLWSSHGNRSESAASVPLSKAVSKDKKHVTKEEESLSFLKTHKYKKNVTQLKLIKLIEINETEGENSKTYRNINVNLRKTRFWLNDCD